MSEMNTDTLADKKWPVLTLNCLIFPASPSSTPSNSEKSSELSAESFVSLSVGRAAGLDLMTAEDADGLIVL